jgi:hypothetical protein
MYPLIYNTEEKELTGPTLYIVSLVCFSVVILKKKTGLQHLLAFKLLTKEKKTNLVIRGNIVLNDLQGQGVSLHARFTRPPLCAET